jgi:5-methyltetrahydropteroyltriglutamate--homocysteine methyltransferase
MEVVTMAQDVPLFPVTVVGSLPRSKAVLKAMRGKQKGQMGDEEFNRIADEAVIGALKL